MRLFINLPGPFATSVNLKDDSPSELGEYQHLKEHHQIPPFPWISAGFFCFVVLMLFMEPALALIALFTMGWLFAWRIVRYVKLARANARWWKEWQDSH